MKAPILSVEIHYEQDVVQARQVARQLAQGLHFDHQDQIRIATAISELARNVYQYAKKGKVEFAVECAPDPIAKKCLVIRVKDKGPGIPHIEEVLGGAYVSKTGMGKGLSGVRRLVDVFQIQTAEGQGTEVELKKILPGLQGQAITAADVGILANQLVQRAPSTPFHEIQRQNQELLELMEALKAKEAELVEANLALNTTNQELEETNRGVVALYTELDEKAAALKVASELKGRFLSYMSHEFRTPINSILGLSRMLLNRMDGELTGEQDKQVKYIHRAAESILEMVNDLLDLSKAESGKDSVKAKAVHLEEVFSGLKGLMRPLLATSEVELEFEPAEKFPPLFTDEGKLNQILRNLISNAIKFTEQGTVSVSVRQLSEEWLELRVQDTGIGIGPADQARIFEEYQQVDSSLQNRNKGTGLGLPLVKRLTELLGGQVFVLSEAGKGSCFRICLPFTFSDQKVALPRSLLEKTRAPVFAEKGPLPRVLIADDEEVSRYLLRNLLDPAAMQILEAASGAEALIQVRAMRPAVIFLDYFLGDMNAPDLLAHLAQDESTKNIPVILRSSRKNTEADRLALGASVVAVLPKEFTSGDEEALCLQQALTKAGLASGGPCE